MNKLKRILITPGEPAGIGPDITISIAQKAWDAELIVIADPKLLQERATQINLPLQLIEADLKQPAAMHQAGTLKIIPCYLQQTVIPGVLSADNVVYVIETLQLAAKLCLDHSVNALVTGPVNKSIINQAGISFKGHTEFLAQAANVPLTVMLFVVDQLKVALLTTHLSLADVPKAITREHLSTTLMVLHDDLRDRFKVISPRISVCGLNPHAGENGYLGREEIDTITPLLAELREQNYNIQGPLPADTLFTPKVLAETDAVLGMYHDQVLPIVKYIGFGHAVNMTLGLPFIRTSVDHGTALDIAGTGKADAGSLQKALELAIKLA